MRARLRMTGWQHQNFEGHLYPGDGLEALAFATCGVQVNADVTTLLVRHVHLVPYGECRREENLLEWRTERLVNGHYKRDLCGHLKRDPQWQQRAGA